MIKKGFTLAEVLVTLSILGVVAAITIPTAINNHKKTETIAKLKIAYKLLDDITETSRIENRTLNFVRKGYATEDFNKYVRPYINISKDCGTGNQTGDKRCFASPKGGVGTI